MRSNEESSDANILTTCLILSVNNQPLTFLVRHSFVAFRLTQSCTSFFFWYGRFVSAKQPSSVLFSRPSEHRSRFRASVLERMAHKFRTSLSTTDYDSHARCVRVFSSRKLIDLLRRRYFQPPSYVLPSWRILDVIESEHGSTVELRHGIAGSSSQKCLVIYASSGKCG